MQAKHRSCVLNDNLNGTLSQVGIYNKPVIGNTCPALVISQKPLDKTETPMEKARVLGDKTTKPIKTVKLPKPTPSTLSHFKTNTDAKMLWDYIQPYLPQPLTSLNNPNIYKLFEHPRARCIKWRKTWLKRTLDDDWKQIAALLVHLVGIEHEDTVMGCTFCRRSEGPFKGCQVLPHDASYEASKLIKSCANCFFVHRRDHCSTKSGWERRCKSRVAATSAAASSLTTTTTTNNKRPYVEESDDEREEPRLSRRLSERMRARVPEVKVGDEPVRKLVMFPLLSKEKQSVATGPSRKDTAMAESSSTALMSLGQIDPEGLLEMEEWEIAPGRIRETGVVQPDSKLHAP